ncbi:uncharacterized protein G2W53_027239 [Senna tora]|uniref:Uncharacterized protein n=1 Tax=Senna tora TaxID=362788 RepID=A0A834TIN1_9FABA|nr:uncharacterized protein G2W53_027239 [Senna tora]
MTIKDLPGTEKIKPKEKEQKSKVLQLKKN